MVCPLGNVGLNLRQLLQVFLITARLQFLVKPCIYRQILSTSLERPFHKSCVALEFFLKSEGSMKRSVLSTWIFSLFLVVSLLVSFAQNAYACGCSGCCNPPAPYPPSWVEASDGEYADRIIVSWLPPAGGGGIYNYRLYRSVYSTHACRYGDIINSDIDPRPLGYEDRTNVVPGVEYWYSIDSVGPGGVSFCSNIDPGFAAEVRPNPPRLIDASDGNPNDRIRVQWEAPVRGGPVASYRLYRSESYTSCSDNFYLQTVDRFTTVYDDFNYIVPGRLYYYSMQSVSPSGFRSLCSNVDSGYIGGTQVYQISGVVTLLGAPGNPGVSGATITTGVTAGLTNSAGHYTLTSVPRGTYNLTASKVGYVITPNTFVNPIFVNTNLVNRNFVATCASGYFLLGNECVSDSGLPSTPINLQASDGTSTECVNVTWNPASRANFYILYRSQYPTNLGDAFSSQITTTSFCDGSAVPGVTYYYTVRAFNGLGQSGLSNTDPGFRGTVTPGDADCDGDMVSDAQETFDGTGVCDPGSFQLHLRSPAFTKYNTFLSQLNYLELMASGVVAVEGRITVYDINGGVLAQRTFRLQPGAQQDTDINALVGRADTYGVVRIDFNHTTAGATLRGRLSNYRYNPDRQTFSFAFARELRNPTRGVTYASGNSIDPQGQNLLVPNWAEVVNLEPTQQAFTVNLYAQGGQLLLVRRVLVPPLGSRDIHAGHELGQSVYLAEFKPDNGAAHYFGSVARYSSNSTGGAEARTYNFAFLLDARSGNGDRQFTPISNLTGQCWSQSNWLEVINTRERSITANVQFRAPNGAPVSTSSIRLAPRAQFHFNASAFLDKDTNGSVQLTSSDPNSIVSQSNVYYHDCQDNLLQTAYASQARLPGRDKQAGSFNTFLGITNLVRVISTNELGGNFQLTLQSGGTILFDQTQAINGANALQFNLSDFGTFNTAADRNGSLTVRTTQPGQVLVESLRFREVNGKADFAMPTAVQ